MVQAAFICDESLWAGGHPPGHPLRPERLQQTWQMLQAYRAFDAPGTRVVPPRRPTGEELATFHTPEYIEAVRRLSRGETGPDPVRFNFGPGDNPVFAGMFESEGLKVGSALVGVELLLQGETRVAFSFAGGLHHAAPDHASGFCVFGDGAIAIHRLLAAGRRVAYVDIDAHHGDGVQAAFYDDDRVLTISFHESGRYLFPGTGFPAELGRGRGEGFCVNVPLFPYTGDETYLWAFDQLVPPLLRRFAPDVVVAQLGLDAHRLDPLTHLALTSHGFEVLFQRLHRLAPRWLALGGGGYEPTVVPRIWTLAWAVMSGQTFSNELPPSVAESYHPPFLHDASPASISPTQQEQARQAAEQVVAEVKAALGVGGVGIMG
jgi:acetoin utilization protein AcuC